MQEEVKQEAQTEEQRREQEAAQADAGAEAEAAQAATKEQQPEQPDPRDQEIAELKNRLLRLQADFDNYRRRSLQEKEQLATFVTAGVAGKFLRVLDNFERAEASAAGANGLESLLTGIKQIRRQFAEAFKELGIDEIAALIEKFVPILHEAVMRGQNPELADETIDMVLEKGYKLKEKVIRHSKVRVVSNE